MEFRSTPGKKALADAHTLSAAPSGPPSLAFAWTAIGPQPMLNNYPNFGGIFTGPPLTSSAGRVAAVACDPATANLMYVGAAGGGVSRPAAGAGLP